MVDLHCHVLPGVDDGPPAVEDALAVARAHVEAGVKTVVATSHVSRRYSKTAATLSAAATELRSALMAEGIALEVLPETTTR